MRRPAWVPFLAILFIAAPLFAAAPVYTNNFSSVTLDGVRLGTDLDPSNYSMFPTVVYDSSSGIFHMWVFPTSSLSIEGLRHGTSSDGVHFISTGNLSFAGGSPFPIYGAPVEPQFEFPRAAKDGSDWKLLLWTENNPSGTYGDYNYNESVNEIGVDPGTLAVTHQGPVYPTNGAGTYGQTTGPFGLVGGKLYVQDDRVGGISKWTDNDTMPPSVDTPADASADLITGTGYVYFLTHPGDPLGVYVHNIGRVLDQGDGTLGVYYSLRHPDGSRVNKQIYYAQSGDGGQTWSSPVGLFSNGDAVRVDGAANTFNFSHPEVTLVGARRVLYFSTKAADGQFVVATSAAQTPSTGSWADILGSGQGDGETGVGAVRTSDGGYAILANNRGFPGGVASFWLVKLDGSGDVEWQKLYSGTGASGTFFPSALAEASDGGLVMAGEFITVDSPMWLLKVDALGGIVWSKTYSTCDAGTCGNAVHSLVSTADGGFAFAGSVAASSGTFGLGRIDAGGNLLWCHSYPVGATPSGSISVAETTDGGLGAGGNISAGFLDADYRVLKTNSSGSIVWDQQFGTNANEIFGGLAAASSGGLVAAGSAGGGNTLFRLDGDGNLLWQESVTGQPLGYPRAVAKSADDRFGVAGFGVSGTAQRATLLEVDANGVPQWAKSFAAIPSSTASFHAVVPTFDGGFLAAGADTVLSNARALAVKVDPGGQFVGCLDVEASIPVSTAPSGLAVTALASTMVDETANTTVADAPAIVQTTDAAERIVCRATLPTELEAAALSADASGNGVADPGERFIVTPAWTNDGLLATFLSGHTSAVSDSNGLDTTDPDLDADYGTIASLATEDCATATGDCYQFGFQNVPRPSQHWDTYFDETLSTSDPHHRYAKRWTVHAGLSFGDVSPASGFYPFVENIFHNGITGGCGAGIYCPTNSVTRAQMSVFLLKSKHGASYAPPPCTPGAFGDVACPSLFADWIEELYNEGITAGCGNGNYCPNDTVTRQQMSAFLLKAVNGSGYVPPTCLGIFGDVACPSLFADWIEDLYNRQITAGCSASPLLYCPADPNTRQQMAVFLVKTFSLTLYGP